MDYRERNTIEPRQRGGKPCIQGLRITVYDILEYLAAGMTPGQILADFPDLEAEDISAVLAFAANRELKLSSNDSSRSGGGSPEPPGRGSPYPGPDP